MAGTLKWDYDDAQRAVNELNSASTEIDGKTVELPSGCGASQADASRFITTVEMALTGMQTSIPGTSTLLSSASESMRKTDENNASSTPTSHSTSGSN